MRPSRLRQARWFLLGILALSIPLFAAWRDRYASVAVRTATVQPDTVTLTAEAVGSLVPEISTDVGSRVAGTLGRLLVREGEMVRQGQALGYVRPDEGIGEVDRAASAKMDAEARVASAQADLTQSERDQSRLRMLDSIRKGQPSLVTSEAHERAEFAVQRAQAALVAARAVARAATALAREAEASVNSAELVAPHDGIVLAIHRRVGETVVPATYGGEAGRVLTIVTPKLGRVRIPVSDRAALVADPRDDVEVSLLADPGYRLEGYLVRIAPRLRDSEMDGFEAELNVTGAGPALPFGASILVKIILMHAAEQRVVPLDAVMGSPDGETGVGVYVMASGDTAAYVPVTIAATGDRLVALGRGPAAGQRVLVPPDDGSVVLRPGLRVRAR